MLVLRGTPRCRLCPARARGFLLPSSNKEWGREPKLSLRVRYGPSALFDTVGVMTGKGEQAPVALNDGMGGSERKRVIEVPKMASLYIECLGPMGQVVSRATGFVVRDEKARPYLVTNRHVVTGRNSLDENRPILNRDGSEVIAPSALRIAMPSRERPGVWKPCVYDLGDEEYKPTWREHPDLGWKVDVITLPIHVDDEVFDLPHRPTVHQRGPAARPRPLRSTVPARPPRAAGIATPSA